MRSSDQASAEAGPDDRPPAPTPPSIRTYVLHPGSLEQSTSLWWAAPPAVAWIGVVVAVFAIHLRYPALPMGTPILWTLFTDLIATAGWMVLVLATQDEKGTERADGTLDPRARHEFWRARTIAWDLLAVSIVGALLVALILGGASSILPTADVPFVELAVLILTIVLLATFSRYAAMAFNTDAARMVQKLEELAAEETRSRQAETARIGAMFTNQTDRIVAKADAQIEATSEGLARATTQIQRVATAIEEMTKLDREARRAAEEEARAQRDAAARQRELEEQRAGDEQRAAAERLETIRPIISVRIRFEGILIHRVVVDVNNDGFDGIGLDVTVRIGPQQFKFTEVKLSSKSTRSYAVTEVSRIRAEAQIYVVAGLRDVDAHAHVFGAGPFRYVRDVGWLGRTKSLFVDPPGWVRAKEVNRSLTSGLATQ
jgi:hypothetical protein